MSPTGMIYVCSRSGDVSRAVHCLMVTCMSIVDRTVCMSFDSPTEPHLVMLFDDLDQARSTTVAYFAGLVLHFQPKAIVDNRTVRDIDLVLRQPAAEKTAGWSSRDSVIGSSWSMLDQRAIADDQTGMRPIIRGFDCLVAAASRGIVSNRGIVAHPAAPSTPSGPTPQRSNSASAVSTLALNEPGAASDEGEDRPNVPIMKPLPPPSVDVRPVLPVPFNATNPIVAGRCGPTRRKATVTTVPRPTPVRAPDGEDHLALMPFFFAVAKAKAIVSPADSRGASATDDPLVTTMMQRPADCTVTVSPAGVLDVWRAGESALSVGIDSATIDSVVVRSCRDVDIRLRITMERLLATADKELVTMTPTATTSSPAALRLSLPRGRQPPPADWNDLQTSMTALLHALLFVFPDVDIDVMKSVAPRPATEASTAQASMWKASDSAASSSLSATGLASTMFPLAALAELGSRAETIRRLTEQLHEQRQRRDAPPPSSPMPPPTARRSTAAPSPRVRLNLAALINTICDQGLRAYGQAQRAEMLRGAAQDIRFTDVAARRRQLLQ